MDSTARTARSLKHNRTSGGCQSDNIKTETHHHSPQPQREKMCLCGRKGWADSPPVCLDPSMDFPACPCVCLCWMFTLDVCVRVWVCVYVCLGRGGNAFCYLPFSLEGWIQILASFVGSNETLFVQTFQTGLIVFFHFEFVTIASTCSRFSTERIVIHVS